MSEVKRFDAITVLEETGALRQGHFQLSSGRHSDMYVQCSQLLKFPRHAASAGRAIAAAAIEELEAREEAPPDLVISPAIGGLIIGFATALALDIPMLFAERYNGEMLLRRGFTVPKGANVLLVEDVITTGGSILELASIVEAAGAKVSLLACIADRGQGDGLGYPLVSLCRIDVNSWPPDECALCANGIPIDSPGSSNSG